MNTTALPAAWCSSTRCRLQVPQTWHAGWPFGQSMLAGAARKGRARRDDRQVGEAEAGERRPDEEAEAVADDLDRDPRGRRPAGKRQEARIVGLERRRGQELGLGRADQLDLPLHQPARAHQPRVVDGGDPLPIRV